MDRRSFLKSASAAMIVPPTIAQLDSLQDAFTEGFKIARPRVVRTISQFAIEEIILPSGPFKGLSFDLDRQPFAQRLFNLIELGYFCRYAIVGPTQTGKTFCGLVIPLMYHLFEIGENVVYGIPTMKMAMDKWQQDLLPAIMASRYAALMPKRGTGSDGGKFESITFENGATLKFMSAKGDDATRSGFTCRVLGMTEIDKYDEASESSDESDPITQMIARLDSYEMVNTIVYMECSPSVEKGRIWQEYNKAPGRIMTPCPHGDHYVCLDRADLIGWDDAETELDARENANFACPECGGFWSQSQREEANRKSLLVFPGQSIVDGRVTGPMPRSMTGGFRWNSANNVLKPAADFASKEWNAKYHPGKDPESTQKGVVQFTWAMPWGGVSREEIDIDEELIASRLTGLPEFVVPDDYETLVVKIDVHNRNLYWFALATSADGVRSCPAYGIQPTPFEEGSTPDDAILAGLKGLKEHFEACKWRKVNGDAITPDLFGVDAGYVEDVVLKFVTAQGPRWIPCKGQGHKLAFRTHKERSIDIVPGFHWYQSRQPAKEAAGNRKWWLTISDTNYWMRQIHGGLKAETWLEDGSRRPGSIALYGDDPQVHRALVDKTIPRSSVAAQLVAWKLDELLEWVPQYSKDGRDDHFFDTAYDCLPLDLIVRSYDQRFRLPVRKEPQNTNQFTTPDGRPYFLTERE